MRFYPSDFTAVYLTVGEVSKDSPVDLFTLRHFLQPVYVAEVGSEYTLDLSLPEGFDYFDMACLSPGSPVYRSDYLIFSDAPEVGNIYFHLTDKGQAWLPYRQSLYQQWLKDYEAHRDLRQTTQKLNMRLWLNARYQQFSKDWHDPAARQQSWVDA